MESTGQTSTDTEEAIARIDEHAERIKRSQVQYALDQLAADGDLDPATREAVERLADRLTARLLAPPRSVLQATDGDAAAIEVALELFGD